MKCIWGLSRWEGLHSAPVECIVFEREFDNKTNPIYVKATGNAVVNDADIASFCHVCPYTATYIRNYAKPIELKIPD